MNAREEFERIKGNIKDLRKAMIELGQHPMMNESDLKDIETLINIIDTLEQKSIQDNETIKYYMNLLNGYQTTDSMNKVQMSSLYGIYKEKHKNVDTYILIKDSKNGVDDVDFKNVDVEIKEKFIQVYNGTRYFNYNINEVVLYELKDSIDRQYIENDNKILQDYIIEK